MKPCSKTRSVKSATANILLEFPLTTPFFCKQSNFDPRPENCLSFSKKSPEKNCLAIV